MTDRDLLYRLRSIVPEMQARAAALDEAAAFPAADIAALREAGILAAPVPRRMGGLGLGTEPDTAATTLEMLRLLGCGNLALGRLVEAHVNALRLVFAFGGPALCERVAADTRAGALLGLWVTDPPDGGVAARDGTLSGAKQFCSGAGHVSHAVVTAEADGATRLAFVPLGPGVTVQPLPAALAGMRAAKTGQVRFDGCSAAVFGHPGDYLREPDFSCGAWRTSAATLGGLDALTAAVRTQLVARGRAGDPHQQARFGHMLIAAEGARLWMAAASERAERAAPGAVTYVGLARLAVERAALDAIELAQRSLGAAAVMRGNAAERISRDLATYLRQPAADNVLTEAAADALAAA